MTAHVDSCSSCSDAVNEYRRLRHGLRSLPARVPSPTLTTSLQIMASHERARLVARSELRQFVRSLARWRPHHAQEYDAAAGIAGGGWLGFRAVVVWCAGAGPDL